MRGFLSLLLALLFVVATAWGLWALAGSDGIVPSPEPPGPRVARVQLLRLALQRATPEIEAYGTLEPCRRAPLASEVAGRIVAVHPDWREGAQVARGDLLWALDVREAEADAGRTRGQLAGAQVELDQADLDERAARRGLVASRRQLSLAIRAEERLVDLFSAGTVPESLVERAQAERAGATARVATGEAALERAPLRAAAARARIAELEAFAAALRLRMEKARVTAPFAGRLVGRAPAVGSLASQGQVLGELLDTSRLRLALAVAESDRPRLSLGLLVHIDLPALPGQQFSGRVAALGRQAAPESRAVTVVVDLDPVVPHKLSAQPGTSSAEHALLMPGQFAHARIALPELAEALILPRAALLWTEGRPAVFIVERDADGVARAALRYPRLGGEMRAGLQVLDGLQVGADLILAPLELLSDGAPVLLPEARQSESIAPSTPGSSR